MSGLIPLNVRKRIFLFFSLLFVLVCSQALAQQKKQVDSDEGCTSITAGRLATTDGSVMVGHTCDGNYRTWVNVAPHKKDDKGSTRKIDRAICIQNMSRICGGRS